MGVILISQIIVFIFGLLVGSFLNAVIYRLKENKTILFDRSICPHCKHKLDALDLIPLFSFIFLKGRCRYCRQKISWQYPIVELSTAVLFLTIFNFQFSALRLETSLINIVYAWLVFSFLLVIFVYDLKYWLIPDEIVYSAIVIIFLYHLYIIISGEESITLFAGDYLLSAIISAVFFFSIWLFSNGKWMGFGDVKLAFLLGLFLGLSGSLIALFSAFFTGAIIGLGLILFQGRKLKSQIPFAPFLVFGIFLSFFFAQPIIKWYLDLIL